MPFIIKPLIGRLGNKLFQWASVYGLAVKYNASYCVSGARSLVANFVGPFNECSAWHAALPPCSLAVAGAPCAHQYTEQGPHRFDPLPVNEPYVRFIASFLSSYRYFQHAETEVRRRLRFRMHIQATARSNAARSPCVQANPSAALAAVHVRRTDRARQQLVPDAAYFDKAMRYIRAKRAVRGVCFLVASDDVDWCHSQPVFHALDVYIDNDTRPGVSMAMLSQCQDHVISVGTFGWWGAWLGRRPAQCGASTCTTVHFANEDLGQRKLQPRRSWSKMQSGSTPPPPALALLPQAVSGDYFPHEWVAF